MTTDPFTDAARAEAIRAWTTPQFDGGNVIGQLGQHMAEWARAHLAAQEPTDADIRVAALAVSAVDDNGCFFCTPDHTPCELCTKYARAALTAARLNVSTKEQNR